MKNVFSRAALFLLVIFLVSIDVNAQEVIEDVTRFSNISTKELKKIMGKPVSKEDMAPILPDDKTKLKIWTYDTDKGHYEFVIAEKKVVRLSIYSPKAWSGKGKEFTFSDKEDISSMFNVSSENGRKTSNSPTAYRFKPADDKIKDFWVPSIKENTFYLVNITYNLDHFGALPAEIVVNEDSNSADIALIFILLLFVFIIVLIIVIASNSAKKAKQKKLKANKLKSSGAQTYVELKHVYGLPIAENMMCGIFSYSNKFEFKSGKMNFELTKNKIIDISTKTDIEIQNQYVSSAGGAVAGGLMFGPLGAIIGGRVKKKSSTTRTSYFIITYQSENEIKYICFEATNALQTVKNISNEFFKQKDQTNISL